MNKRRKVKSKTRSCVSKVRKKSLLRTENRLTVGSDGKLLKQLFQKNPHSLLAYDPESLDILLVNSAATHFYGYSERKFMSMKIKDLFIERDWELYVRNTLTNKENSSLSSVGCWKHIKKGGNSVSVETYVLSIVVGRKTMHLLVNLTNVIGAKKIRKQLRESEERLKLFYQDAPIGIYRITPAGYVVLANQTFAKMLGYATVADIMMINIEEKGYYSKKTRQAFIDIIEKNGETNGFESKWLTRDNSTIFVRENARAIRDENNVTLFYEGTVEDITEKKTFENLLLAERQLFVEGPVITIKWRRTPTPYSPVEYVSPNIENALGYSYKEFTTNKLNFHSIIHPDDLARVKAEAKEMIEKGVASYQQEYRIKDTRGNYHWYFDFTRVIKDEEDRITHLHGYLFDISDRKEAEEELKQSKEVLRELNLTKDKFFSIIAHDLRSPFQGLLGISSILVEEDSLTLEERLQYERKLFEGIKNQYGLLDALLTWSRLQRGVIEFKPEESNLLADTEEAFGPLLSTATKKDQKLECQISESLYAKYDRNMIATVVRNLVSNAIKFTGERGKITVNAKVGKSAVTVTVSDTGIGMSQEDIEKLFRIDTHFSRRGTNDEGGSGLGLILCKEFIDKHNGKIWAESELGNGTSFHFSIPQ